ncbi:MAG: hypothetical protein OEW88_08970 [Gammaproteobacteria bacterium]|nr:hypothetical protein [Gammaproteobacteria bacterium]
MKKQVKKAGTAAGGGHRHATKPTKAGSAVFSAEDADAFQVVDQITALRGMLAAIQKRPFSLAMSGPAAAQSLLDVLENLNLRLAELESRD